MKFALLKIPIFQRGSKDCGMGMEGTCLCGPISTVTQTVSWDGLKQPGVFFRQTVHHVKMHLLGGLGVLCPPGAVR